MDSKIIPLGVPRYRGFDLACVRYGKGYKAAWKSSFEEEWVRGETVVKRIRDVEQIARGCIDNQCSEEVEKITKLDKEIP